MIKPIAWHTWTETVSAFKDWPILFSIVHNRRRHYERLFIVGSPHGHFGIIYAESILKETQGFTIPDRIPVDAAEYRDFLRDYSLFLAVAVAEETITLDHAYLLISDWVECAVLCRFYEHQGFSRAHDFPKFTGMIDEAVPFLLEVIPQVENRLFWALRAVAISALNSNASLASVRQSMARAALTMRPMPSSALLFEALNDAIGEARRNAKWMKSRDQQVTA